MASRTPDQFVLSGGSPVGLTCCALTAPIAATLMTYIWHVAYPLIRRRQKQVLSASFDILSNMSGTTLHKMWQGSEGKAATGTVEAHSCGTWGNGSLPGATTHHKRVHVFTSSCAAGRNVTTHHFEPLEEKRLSIKTVAHALTHARGVPFMEVRCGMTYFALRETRQDEGVWTLSGRGGITHSARPKSELGATGTGITSSEGVREGLVGIPLYQESTYILTRDEGIAKEYLINQKMQVQALSSLSALRGQSPTVHFSSTA